MRKVQLDELESLLDRYAKAKEASVGELSKLKARRDNDRKASEVIRRFGAFVSELETLVGIEREIPQEAPPPQVDPNAERQREPVSP